jgi:hypothetical protein
LFALLARPTVAAASEAGRSAQNTFLHRRLDNHHLDQPVDAERLTLREVRVLAVGLVDWVVAAEQLADPVLVADTRQPLLL